MHHEISIGGNDTQSVCFWLGVECGTAKILAIANDFTLGFVNSELEKVSEYWRETCSTSTIATPSPEFDELVNKWLKKQAVYLTRTNRMGPVCPIRNQLQDAMGYALFEPEKAKEYFFDVFKTQESSGYIKQWHTTNGAKPTR